MHPLPALLSLIGLPIWRGKTGEAEHIFDRHKTDMQVKINAAEWSLSPEALPLQQNVCMYMCVFTCGAGKRGSGRPDYSHSHFHSGAWQRPSRFPQEEKTFPCPQIKDKLWRLRSKDMSVCELNTKMNSTGGILDDWSISNKTNRVFCIHFNTWPFSVCFKV